MLFKGDNGNLTFLSLASAGSLSYFPLLISALYETVTGIRIGNTGAGHLCVPRRY
jgi:hypothetical protein